MQNIAQVHVVVDLFSPILLETVIPFRILSALEHSIPFDDISMFNKGIRDFTFHVNIVSRLSPSTRCATDTASAVLGYLS